MSERIRRLRGLLLKIKIEIYSSRRLRYNL